MAACFEYLGAVLQQKANNLLRDPVTLGSLPARAATDMQNSDHLPISNFALSAVAGA